MYKFLSHVSNFKYSSCHEHLIKNALNIGCYHLMHLILFSIQSLKDNWDDIHSCFFSFILKMNCMHMTSQPRTSDSLICPNVSMYSCKYCQQTNLNFDSNCVHKINPEFSKFNKCCLIQNDIFIKQEKLSF